MRDSLANEQALIEKLLSALRALPEAQAELGSPSLLAKSDEAGSDTPTRSHDSIDRKRIFGSYNAAIHLRLQEKAFTILVEAKRTVYPQDARVVLWQFWERRHRKDRLISDDSTIQMLIAESISPAVKELLREEGIGYFDTGGSLFLPAPGAYFYIDKAPPKAEAKAIGSAFAGRRAQVVHTLLMQANEWFTGKALAEQALVSPATVSQVLRELGLFGWLDSRGQGPNKERRLSAPAAALEAWAKRLAVSRPPVPHLYFVPTVNTDALLKRLDETCTEHNVQYAVSYEAAAQRYAPYISSISQVRARLLAGPSADAAISALGARAVSEGANLVIVEAKSAGDLLFAERVGNNWLASPVQVYLDLLNGQGRAKEMAAHLRKERIKF
jgi:hypothetical protein